MFSVFLIACLLTFPQGQSVPLTVTSRYKSTEEMNVNDITFTTSSPDHSKPFSLKPVTYHNAIKHEYSPKNTKGLDKITKPLMRSTYSDSLEKMTSVDQIYITEKPKMSSTLLYRPLRFYSTQKDHDGHNGFRPGSYFTKGSDKVNPTNYKQAATGYNVKSTKAIPKRYAAKIAPFPVHSSGLNTFDHKNKQSFTPSMTTSKVTGQEITQISGGVLTTFPGIREKETYTFHSEPIKFTSQPESKTSHYEQQQATEDDEEPSRLSTENFFTTSGNFRENDEPTPKDSTPQQSETFSPETSAPQNDDKSENNLEEVADSVENLKTGERVEFQMYGMDGPKSYKFGFDTGKGQNRHFRFEERDKSGKVKGHYGYIDEEGKMRIMKYEADPLTGFRAGPVELTENDN